MRPKCRSRKRNSPRHRTVNNRSWEESSDQESVELPRSISPYTRMVVSEITGNLTCVPDSVVLDIGDSTTSSSNNSSDGDIEEEEDEEGEDHVELHCDDWEIKMLAAELNRRESNKKEESSEALSDADEHGGLLRRRRKRSDTDTECSSEITEDTATRPRASSLDQHNLHQRSKTKGVFKAMSFDRDKDRL